MRLHYYIVVILVKICPKLFDRYFGEYQEVFVKYRRFNKRGKEKRKMDNFLYKMKLHEELNFNTFRILRVPGGWVYTNHQSAVTTVFVPFNTEFNNELPEATPQPSGGSSVIKNKDYAN